MPHRFTTLSKPEKIFLVGLPGSGKTTLGRPLAKELGLPYFDLDHLIEKKEQAVITDIFKQKGEAYFRLLEHETLVEFIVNQDEYVLSTGGGTPCFHENMERMNENGVTVFINTPIERIKTRIQQDSTRPLMKTNTLEGLWATREKYYRMSKNEATDWETLLNIFT